MSFRKENSVRELRERAEGAQAPKLRKTLNPWQIFFIAVSGLVGTGVFSSNGTVLKAAGPGGYLLAMGIVGVIAIAFMESLSELIQAFPCANSLSEYVDIFVDPELASVVGVAYWLTWGIYWALMITAAGQYASSWNPGSGVIVPVFFIIFPMVMVGINLVHVSLFGWIETVGGLLKTIAVVALSLTVYYLAGQLQSAPSHLSDGFVREYDWHRQAINVCSVLPLLAYSWIGVEIVAVTAFEAKSYADLRAPSQALPYFVFILYFICAVGESLALSWNEPGLPAPLRRDESTSANPGTGSISQPTRSAFSSSAAVIIAATQVGQDKIAEVFNGVLIFCALSAGNTCLYVASRTLYGFAFHDRRRNSRGLRTLALVTKSGIPKYAVLFTAAVFGWLPFLSLAPEPQNLQFAEWLGTVASLSGLFVWSAVCIAYIRYWHWLYRFKGRKVLTENNPTLNRFNPATRHAQTVLGFAQPFVAYLGATGSLLILLVFSSGFFWQRPATGFLITQTFFVPIVALAAWLMLKLLRYYNPGETRPFAWHTVWADDEDGLQQAFNKLVLASGHTRHARAHHDEEQELDSTTDVVIVDDGTLPARLPSSHGSTRSPKPRNGGVTPELEITSAYSRGRE